MNQRSREFGERVSDVTYVDRPSAYAVIIRGATEVAVVQTPRGCFLPGGGRDEGETPVQAVVREALEECGLRIRIIRHLGDADQLVFTRRHANGWRKRCQFFSAAIDVAEPCECQEADHVLLWLPLDDALARLAHESQRWAVKEAAV